jgi:hypothetical protein
MLNHKNIGCHDNGYVANLHSQITAGYKEKLILLKSYTEMAGGIATLGLPSFAIPPLFMPEKIGDTIFSPIGISPKDLPHVFGTPLSGNVNLGPDTSSFVRPIIPNVVSIPCTYDPIL